MPYTPAELKIRRIEREIAGLSTLISLRRKEVTEKVERRNVLLDRLKTLKDAYDAMIGKPKTLSETITSAAVTLGECQAEWMADPD
jgi:hypothetical protein